MTAAGGAAPAARVVVLLPALLAVVALGPVLGSGVALVLLVPTLLIAALLAAVALLARASLVGAVLVAAGVSVAAWLVVGLVAPPGQATAAAAAAAAVALTASAGQLLVVSARPATALLPSLLLLGFALAAGAATRPGSALLAAAFAASAALVLLVCGPWNTAAADRAARPTRGGVVLATVASLAAGGVALAVTGTVAPSLPTPVRVAAGADPAEQPLEPPTIDDVDPLTQAVRWQSVERDDPRTLVTVRGPTSATRLTWVTLARYDGRGWDASRFFSDPGPRFDVTDDLEGVSTAPAVTRLLVGAALPGPWVPVRTQVTQVVGLPVWADREGGAVVSSSSPVGASVEVRSEQVRASQADLVAAAPGPAPAFAPETALPGTLPAAMRALVDDAARVGISPYQRLVALAEALRAPRYQGVDVRTVAGFAPGRTLADLDAVVRDGVGMQEQYAAIFALGARDWNVPTRLVIGWLSPASKGADVDVRAAATSVWVQAELKGVGWVSFQPSPQDRDAGRAAVVALPRPLPPSPTSSPSPTATAATPSATAAPGPEESSGSGGLPGWVLPLVAVLLLAGAWPLGVALVRSRRRRALAADPDPARRAVGAWRWSRALLAEAGSPVPPGLTPDLVAAGALDDALPGGAAAAVRAVAAAVAPGLYGPDPAGPAAADAAWAGAGELEGVLAQGSPALGRRRRLRLPPVPPAAGDRAPAVRVGR